MTLPNHAAFPVARSETRREMLTRCGFGLGSIGLALLLRERGLWAASPTDGGPSLGKQPHFPARAKRVLQIFAGGGPSQVDTFDPKPLLAKYHGKSIKSIAPEFEKNAPLSAVGMGRLNGSVQQSGFKFQPYGECGTEVSELFPHLAKQVDKLTVVRSMTTKSSIHEPAKLLMATGEGTVVRPSVGSWVTYGLGTENQNLPAFVALRAGEAASDNLFGCGFLPGTCGGTPIDTTDLDVEKMIEHIRNSQSSREERRRQLDLVQTMNRRFQQRREEEAILAARIESFETAFRMQAEAPAAFDISREPEHIRRLYGPGKIAEQLLLARRLLEHGVRFVQVFQTGWDTHDENDRRHREMSLECDQPLAALLADLDQRDMLDDTLVVWGGEFGRTPTSDINDPGKKKGIGRDHNAGGFSMWLAGGGVKGGYVHGATDDFGGLAVEGVMDVHDLHATVLHLLGFDHTKLIFHHAGRDFRLTDVHGHVAHDLIA